MTDVDLKQALALVLLQRRCDPCGQTAVAIGNGPASIAALEDADAVLAAIRASGRLAPEVPGDVAEGAYEASIKAAIAEGFGNSNRRLVRIVLNTAAPLIAAAAEAKAREECARIADEAKRMREELFEQNGASINAARAVQAEEIAAAIRTGAAS